MGFLNPFLLIGLLSAGVPLLIHLWSRRQARVVPFAALRFLLEAHRKTVRRFQIEQWLILVLRTFALACFALAMARPVLHAGWFGGTKGRASVVLILDRSASMGYEGPDGVPFERAKDRAVEVLRSLRPGDDASLVLMAEEPTVLFDPGETNISDVIQAVRAAPLSQGGTRAGAAVARALDLLKRSDAPNKELYILSDFARNGWDAASFSADGARLFLLPVDSPSKENVGVTAIRIENPLVASGIPTTFAVDVRNFGSAPESGRSMEFFVGDEMRRAVALELPAGGEITERFQHTFDGGGLHEIRVRLNDDRFPLDDERALVVPVLGGIDAFVAGDETLYLSLALDPLRMEAPESAYTIRPAAMSFAELDRRSLDDAELLILQNPPLRDARLMGRVRNFLLNGGSVLLFLGDRAEPASFAGLDWLPVSSEGIIETKTPLKLRPAHLAPDRRTGSASEAIFGVFEDAWTRPSAPNFYRAHRLKLRDGAETAALFTDGTPSVAAGRFQQGRLLVVNAPADGSDWSNFSLNPLFLPFLQQAAFYLQTPPIPPKRGLVVGEPYRRTLRVTDPLAVTVETPDGELQTAGRGEDGETLAVEETNAVGIYRIHGAETHPFEDAFAVNPPPEESDFAALSRAEIAGRFDEPPEWLGADDSLDFGAALQAERLGRELWVELLTLGVAALLLEAVLSNRTRRDDANSNPERTPRAA